MQIMKLEAVTVDQFTAVLLSKVCTKSGFASLTAVHRTQASCKDSISHASVLVTCSGQLVASARHAQMGCCARGQYLQYLAILVDLRVTAPHALKPSCSPVAQKRQAARLCSTGNADAHQAEVCSQELLPKREYTCSVSPDPSAWHAGWTTSSAASGMGTQQAQLHARTCWSAEHDLCQQEQEQEQPQPQPVRQQLDVDNGMRQQTSTGGAGGKQPRLPSLLMRLIDDFLFITSSRAAAEALVNKLLKGTTCCMLRSTPQAGLVPCIKSIHLPCVCTLFQVSNFEMGCDMCACMRTVKLFDNGRIAA